MKKKRRPRNDRDRLLERERYRKQQESQGKTVKSPRPPGSVSKEQIHEEMLENSRRYRKNNLERRRKSAREWAKRNRKAQIERWKERYRTDPLFNLQIKIRRRIYMSLYMARKGLRKVDKTINLLGCSYEDFKKYIEIQFVEGMSWDLVCRGEIHLDHIRPCRSFDLSDPAQQKECFHYTNMQPLWPNDNLSKSDLMPNGQRGRELNGLG